LWLAAVRGLDAGGEVAIPAGQMRDDVLDQKVSTSSGVG
jgi:hypothetical protein